MNHFFRVAAAAVAVTALLAGCGRPPEAPVQETAAEHAAKHLDPAYQCPMHPEVRSGEPGRCPICGMDLVLVEPPAPTGPEAKPLYYRHPHDPTVTSPVPRKDEMGMDYVPVYGDAGGGEGGAIELSAAMVNNLGVRTAEARVGEVDPVLQTVGRLAYDERGRVEVRVRAEGYVERLSVRAEGERVRRGQALFAVFSPKLAAAQGEYLQALGLGEATLVGAAEGRLRALGLPPADIARLRAGGKVQERVTYHAPRDGVVTMLGIREGALAEPGMSALTIAPIEQLWVVAEVPESAAAAVRAGAAAKVSVAALPGQAFEAQVIEVLPEMNETTRTLQVRLGLDNAGLRLAAGMLADVTIEAAGARSALLIPLEALIRTGRAERVIVALGEGRFAARDVRAGAESGDSVEILHGLEAGDRVVVSGQFMIDSESQVRSSLRRYGTDEEGAAAGHDHGGGGEHGT
jgi:Cu(I)/Ag(I) efflux system membrane fusion protein